MASNLQWKSQELTTEKAKPFHQSFGNANISTYKRMKLHHHTQKLIQNEARILDVCPKNHRLHRNKQVIHAMISYLKMSLGPLLPKIRETGKNNVTIKLKSCAVQETGVKRTPYLIEDSYFHIVHPARLIPNASEELVQENNPIKKCQKISISISPKKSYRWPTGSWKIFLIITC